MKKSIIALIFALSSMFGFENLTDKNFEQKISKGNVIVDFYAKS